MSTINTILIKRRLASSPLDTVPTLSGGELAYSEKNNVLYYGSEAGTLEIGGSGSYLTRDTDQTASGNKTFTGSTTLSSLTISLDSTLDFGSNVLTNLADPESDQDAATKVYVDTAAAGASSATESLSSEVYSTFVKLTDDRAVDLSGGLTVSSGINADTITTTGNAQVGGNLTIVGDLEVQGNVTSLETTTTVTSAFSVTNAGTTTALTVEQTGSVDIAEFIDDGSTALIIKDGGNVGIGTDSPEEALTVVGNISASGMVYAAGGMDISAGGGATTLYVEDTKVGINTETPNEELTVVGSISATEDVFARNGDFTGTLDVDGATTLGDTLNVTGATTLSDLTVSNAATIGSLTVTNAFDSDGGTIYSDGAGALTVENLTVNVATALTGAVTLGSSLTVDGASTFASAVSLQDALTVDGATIINNTLNVTGEVTIDSALAINANTTTTGNLSGIPGTSEIVGFVIDGGSF